MGDGGKWIRQQCLILAQTNNTPVPFWLSLALPELCEWIRASNSVQDEAHRERERLRNK